MGADSDLRVDFIKIIKIRNSDLYLGIKKKGGGEFYSNSIDRKSTRLNSSHVSESRMPSSA